MPANATQTVIIAFGLLFVIMNSLGLGLSLKVGQMLADFFRQRKLAAWVLLINFVILSELIIGFAAVVHIPADIKIGYCIVALTSPLAASRSNGKAITWSGVRALTTPGMLSRTPPS